MTNKPEWEIEFDFKFVSYVQPDIPRIYQTADKVKDFIASQIEKAEKRGYKRFKEENPRLFCSHEEVSGHQCQNCYAIKDINGWN